MLGGKGSRFALAVTIIGVILTISMPTTAQGQEALEGLNLPTLLTADEVVYDEGLGIVTARGNVEISQEDRVLIADVVNYNFQSGVVTASGNVNLLEPSGEVVFAEYVELSDDLREGFIRDIRVLLTDQSRIAAASGERREGRYVIFRKGVFSPCKLCRDDPQRAPLWQLKANEIVHDQEDKTIQYRDAWLEMFGVPVVYTPYLEHPDPTVKRKSGFLAPSFGASGNLGAVVEVPYFWAIDDHSDATFNPLITTKQSVVLAGQYRQFFETGKVKFEGSATIAKRETRNNENKKDQFRGHIDSQGKFDLDPTWRTGFDVRLATDDTYLRLYNFSASSTLANGAYIEGFRGRNYAAASASFFQGLREGDDNDLSPIVAPLLSYSFESEPGIVGGKYNLDTSLMVLSRLQGRQSRRLSITGGYELPYTSPAGDVYTLVTQLQADGYFTRNVDPGSADVNPSPSDDSNTTGRLFPQMALKWQYPFVQPHETWNQIVEPIAQLVLAPTGSNPNAIPNEDSLGIEFDDTNLFNLNRFAGFDRVDSGSRIDYGLNWQAEGRGLGNVNAFIGQSYRFSNPDDDLFDSGSGLDSRLSDIVGRVSANPIPELALLYRFRFSKDDLESRRSEVDASIGPKALNAQISYIFVKSEEEAIGFEDREEIFLRFNSRLTNNWSAFVTHRRDIFESQTLSTSIGLTYEDECFEIRTVAARTEFRDAEITPEDSIFFTINFKHLGGFSTPEFVTGG